MTFVGKEALAHLGTGPVPKMPYVSPEYFKLERETIFRRVWLFAARVEEFANVGDFVTKNFEVCGVSVLLVKGKDSIIRAFHNVCSHRLAKLVADERGVSRSFTCRYHGWNYGLDGSLRSAPDADSFYDISFKDCALTAIKLEIWNGFIFVNFAPTPEQTLLEYLGPMSSKLSEHAFQDCPTSAVVSAEVDVNWKAMLDNFQETYHLAFVHRLSVGDRAFAEDNPLGHPLSFEFFGPHRFMGIWGNPDHKPAKVEGLAASYGGVSGAGASQQTARYKEIRHKNWQLDVHGIFPNLLIEVAPTFFYTIEFTPISFTRTRWTSRMYLPRAESAGHRISQEYHIAAFRDTAIEDLAVLSSLQSSMMSDAKDMLHFQANEALCRHSYNTVQKYVEGRV
jgi:Rieske 2Fe-2S family protein